MASAADLGRKLLSEVQEVGLDEILHTLRLQDEESNKETFDFKPLDRLIQSFAAPQASSRIKIVELMSLHPGAGKTQLLYYLCARAVLPTHHSGQQACVIIVDTDGAFSIAKLVAQIEELIHHESKSTTAANTDHIVQTALKHIHIFSPQSLPATIATIDSLPIYLFNKTRHSSFDRRLAFIALDSASAFYWQDRADMEDAAFIASTSSPGSSKPTTQVPSGYTALAAALRTACETFKCPALVTSWYLGTTTSTQKQERSYRSSLPLALSTVRLVVQRVPVRKFPVGITLDQASREAADRQAAVDEGKNLCFGNEWGLEERVVQRFRAREGGDGFVFQIREGSMAAQQDGA